MIKKLLFTLSLCMLVGSALFAQSTIKGVVKGPDGYAVPFLQILLKQDARVINGAYTDDNGEYQIFGIPAGTYDITAGGTITCMSTYTEKGIYVSSSEVKFVNLVINCASTELNEVEVQYVPPVFSQDNTSTTTKLTGDEVRKAPGRSITAALSNLEGVATQDGDMKSVRGNRSDGQQTIIDGVRVRGSGGYTMQSVEGAELIQGGIPAEYGDGTSFQIITTRGVAKDFHGGVELRSSLEGYGQFLLAGSVSGPILKGKTPNDPARMGFMISAEGNYDIDNRPLRGGDWIAKPDVIKDITSNPVEYRLDPSANNYVGFYRANDLGSNAFKKTRVRKDAESWGVVAQAKIDIMGGGKDARGKSKNNLRFSIGGSYEYKSQRVWDRRTALFNSSNNGVLLENTMRLNARLNHRVKTDTAANAILKNIMYDININYTLFNRKQQDRNHKDNYFAYGYIGKFTTTRENVYESNTKTPYVKPGDTAKYEYFHLTNYQAESWKEFDPNAFTLNGKYYNPGLVPYTQNFVDFLNSTTGMDPYQIESFFGGKFNSNLYRSYNALLNGDTPDWIANNLYIAPGYVNSGFSKYREEAIGAKASLSLNLKDHEIKFGFDFEKLTRRNYWVGATSLWSLMRELTGNPLNQMIDNTQQYWKHGDGAGGPRFGGYGDQIWIDDTLMYGVITALPNFDRNLRAKKGITSTDTYLDIDSYDPNEFSLDMFSNYELFNQGNPLVEYSGFDYTGKISRKKLNLDNFFSSTDAYGNRNVDEKDKYAIGAFEPIYLALYLQDKFSISNLLFNVGLRLDYYNSNQYVLKDPFLLKDAHTVKDLKNDKNWEMVCLNMPSNVQDDWIPYVSTADNDKSVVSGIVAYRNGKTWYNKLGQEIPDPTADLGQGGPILKQKPELDAKASSDAFAMYKPQWTLMPRISFSFPVSTNSLFYAHYNIITNRPTNWQIDPVAYLFINNYNTSAKIINNPNLRPQRTVMYEIGFRQKVGENAAINIGAYYSEIRDQIQSYRFTGAYPRTYYSFENIDFGTVQGFSVGFNVRGAKNFTFRAGYTLSFAKGTGSSSQSNLAIIASGQPNLRTLTNLEFDQRHKISASIDLRFDQGTSYNGPVSRIQKKKSGAIKEVRWFENAGAILQISAGSGMPYSRSGVVYSTLEWGEVKKPQLKGSINGATKPWTFQCDLRIEKTFLLNLASKKENSETGKRKNKPGMLTVYVDFQNLLNLKNIINVYDYSGKADDDGYLSSSLFQNYVSSLTLSSVEPLMNYYGMRVANPFNYNAPFRVYLGLSFSF